MNLVHIKWIGEGSPGAVVDFLPITSKTGNGALSVNANGWPAAIGGSSSTLNSATGCEDVWIAVLNVGAPSVSKARGSADYQAIYSGSNRCEYQFQAEPQLSFGFDSNTGRVSFNR